MDSVIEIQRQAHEEIEILEQGIVDQYHNNCKTQKDKAFREHQVAKYLDAMTEKCGQLFILYEDVNADRKKEIDAISGTEFTEFYARLKAIKDNYRNNPYQLADVTQQQVLSAASVSENHVDAFFSGEESYGKYLDLHANFDQFINLKHGLECNYLMYLDKVDDFICIPRSCKNGAYKNYLENLQDYIEGFFQRAQPLVDYQKHRAKAEIQFEVSWNSGIVAGWKNTATDGLFCQACSKHFVKQITFDAHLSGKKHIKAQELLQQGASTREDPNRYMAFLETLISTYFQVLEEFREETKANIERKQSLTEKEREIEQEAEEIAIAESDSDDDEKIYNPLKLPLGWDGKPIPYWLFKLHGLGVEYPCEICGNYVYMGRKAFERHFQEWRHAHGMRCLGIPNTRHFNEITSIEDAYSLWERLKQTSRVEKMAAETLEEFEDEKGNVFNKKTYEDLKRQGLL